MKSSQRGSVLFSLVFLFVVIAVATMTYFLLREEIVIDRNERHAIEAIKATTVDQNGKCELVISEGYRSICYVLTELTGEDNPGSIESRRYIYAWPETLGVTGNRAFVMKFSDCCIYESRDAGYSGDDGPIPIVSVNNEAIFERGKWEKIE